MTQEIKHLLAKGVKLDWRFHQAIVNHSAPGGAVNMYEIYNVETKETWCSVGIDMLHDISNIGILAIIDRLNASDTVQSIAAPEGETSLLSTHFTEELQNCSQKENKEPVIKQFEHMAKIFPVHTKFADFLDELGMDGWELCAVQRNEFYFKREVTHAITPTVTELLDVIAKQRAALARINGISSSMPRADRGAGDYYADHLHRAQDISEEALALSDKYVEGGE